MGRCAFKTWRPKCSKVSEQCCRSLLNRSAKVHENGLLKFFAPVGVSSHFLQIYVVTKRAHRAKPVSGEAVKCAALNLMRLYPARTNRKDEHGVLRDGPPQRSMVAVEIQRECPKFCSVTRNRTVTRMQKMSVKTSN